MYDGESFNGNVGCLVVGALIGIVWALIVAASNGGRLL